MMALSPVSVDEVISSLCGPKGTGEELRAIVLVLERARAAGLAGDAEALSRIKAAVAGLDPLFGEPALAFLTGDLNYYVDLIDMLRNVIDLAPLEGINQIYWSMARQIFLMRMDQGSVPNFTADVLFPFYCALVGEISRRYGANPAVWRPKPGDRRKIVLITNQFLSLQHQPTRDLLEQAAALQGGGFDVTILNTNMMPDRYYSPFVPPFAAEIEPQLNGDQVLSYEGRSFRIVSSTAPGLPAEKVLGFLAAVDEIDPDAVVSIGGSAIIADMLAAARPCLCLQTTTGHTVSLAHLVLDYGGNTPPGGDGHYAKAWRPFRLRLSLRQTSSSAAARRDYGVPDDAFACLVVGNRLDYEVSDGFLDLLEGFLAKEPRAFAAFAGPVETLPARLASRAHAGRLRCLGYVDGMVGLMTVCDAYLNPLRTGGGASALQALEAGLPVVSLASGDVASVAGPDFCVPDANAYLSRMVELAQGGTETARAAARERYAAVVRDGDNMDQLVAYIAEAQELFLQNA